MDLREWGETDAAKQWTKRCDEAFAAAVRTWASRTDVKSLSKQDYDLAIAEIALRVARDNPSPARTWVRAITMHLCG